MSDQYAEGMRRAAEIAQGFMREHGGSLTDARSTLPQRIHNAILAAIPAPAPSDAMTGHILVDSPELEQAVSRGIEHSRTAVGHHMTADQHLELRVRYGLSAAIRHLRQAAPAPWTPPGDRPDGYRCWAWWAFDGNDGRWYRAEWHGGNDDPHWWVFGVGFCKHEMVKHFLPEPPAPEAKP